MDYKCRIACTMQINGEVDGKPYTINEGVELTAQSQSIDKKKWFVFVPSIEKFDHIDKYHFDFLIDQHITYPLYYGEFQLPVISDNIHSLTIIAPNGYVTWVSKGDVGVVGTYKEAQRINSDEIRFR